MNYSINFPNLGIYLKYVPKFISIGCFKIALYGICISVGMLLSIFLVIKEAKNNNQNIDDYYNVSIIGIILAVIGARIYYVIFAWDKYRDHPAQIFNIHNGGLAVYGGIITFIFVIIIYSYIKKLILWLMLDIFSISVLIGQIIGRFGNFFNREAFGQYTNSLFAMEIPIYDVNNLNCITSTMLLNAVINNGTVYISVHPTFFYEILWNLCLFIFLLFYKEYKKFDGEVFLIYMSLYGIGRFFIESIRVDQLLIFGTNVPISQIIAVISNIVCVIIIIYKRRQYYNNNIYI